MSAPEVRRLEELLQRVQHNRARPRGASPAPVSSMTDIEVDVDMSSSPGLVAAGDGAGEATPVRPRERMSTPLELAVEENLHTRTPALQSPEPLRRPPEPTPAIAHPAREPVREAARQPVREAVRQPVHAQPTPARSVPQRQPPPPAAEPVRPAAHAVPEPAQAAPAPTGPEIMQPPPAAPPSRPIAQFTGAPRVETFGELLHRTLSVKPR